LGWEWLISTLRLVIWPLGLLWHAPDAVHRGIRPILLVHGYRMNWIVWLYMLRRFSQDGHLNVRAINLPRGTDLETQSVALAHEIDALLARSGARHVDIVAHSMGGIVARLLIQGDYATRIRKLVTIGTPHKGSHLALLGIGPEAQQLTPQSKILERLNAAPLLDAITSLGSSHDTLVLPTLAAIYNPDTHTEFTFLGHNAMLVSDQVYAGVRDILLRNDTHA
jgi:triacylglycerol esterase/lipase EstA (alpha/beta hydrolase family)